MQIFDINCILSIFLKKKLIFIIMLNKIDREIIKTQKKKKDKK